MPETGGEAPFLFQKSYGARGGQGWQGGSEETSGEKTHMGGKEDVANSSQPFRASSSTPLCGTKVS